MDVETKFETWRHAVLHKSPCPPSLQEFVWNTAGASIIALEERVRPFLNRFTRPEQLDIRTDLTLMFLEFIKDNPEKGIGWCFKTFKMRFPDAVTRIEAQRLGLGLKESKGVQSYEVKKLRKQLADDRKGTTPDRILSGLRKPSVPFIDEYIEVDEYGDVVSVDWYEIRRHISKSGVDYGCDNSSNYGL